MTTLAKLHLNQPLTDREREIVEALATGASNPEIGARLFLAPSTVKGHLQRIAVKTGVGDRAGIVGYAICVGYLTVPAAGEIPAEFNARYFEVLVRITRGLSNVEIATDLQLPLETVKSRVRRLLEMFGVDSRQEAVVAGFACGVLRAVPKQRVAP